MKVLVSEFTKECYLFEDNNVQNVAKARSRDLMRLLGITPQKMAKDMRDFILHSRHRDNPFFIDNCKIGIIAINDKYPECLIVNKDRISNKDSIKDRGFLLKTVKSHNVFKYRGTTEYLYFDNESSAIHGVHEFIYKEIKKEYRGYDFAYNYGEINESLNEKAYYYKGITKDDSYYNYFQVTLYQIYLLPRQLTEFEKKKRIEDEFNENLEKALKFVKYGDLGKPISQERMDEIIVKLAEKEYAKGNIPPWRRK